ncbi:FAD-dependent oxidoreductase [Agromyces luteolus]|uniref:NAD(P)-binding protein n=1 Tax=Agromyces luteolus TaxID=88373 RepID=A0A7C9LEJ1_9MICO|nr:FAD-dependent oxidoreductase [Agromyces luteolus]MUN08692.1 NAD(P)-binding protein [Agromyces luteolus]GLK27235.1 FAD-dependent oxidoreductase [Agromyces luteolus]
MRAAVIGAGMAGLASARQLALAGWEVDVLERADGPRADGYMMDFFGLGFDAAERMGLLPRLREVAYRIGAVEYVDARSGRRTASIDYDRFAEALGGRLLSLMRPDLELVLLDALADAPADSVRVHYGVTYDPAEAGDGGGGLGGGLGGRLAGADLVIGADGIHSSVRAALFGDESQFVRPLGLRAAAYVIDGAPDLHAEFDGRFVLTDTVDRQAGIYGLRDGRVAAFLAYRGDAHDGLDPDEDAPTRLRRVFGGLWPPIDRLLERCPPHPYDDVVAQVVLPQWHRGTTVLAGDGCQAVSLLAGQGASMAIAGAELLADLVGPCRDAAAVEAALGEVERRWRPVVEEKQAAGRRAANTFLPPDRLRLLLRRWTLRASSLPVVDSLVMRSIAGGTGLKGRAGA